MKNMIELITLLGEDNVENIKKSITRIIIDRVRSDLDDYSNYLIYPPDIQEMVDGAVEDNYKKLSKMYKDAVLEINKDYIEKLKAYMAKPAEESSLRRKVLKLAKEYYWAGNEYSKDRKMANDLFNILELTQEEMEEFKEQK